MKINQVTRILGLAFFIAACQPIYNTSIPSAPQIISMSLPLNLRPWESILTTCEQAIPEMNIIYLERPATISLLGDISLNLGNIRELDTQDVLTIQLGWENWVIIVHSSNPIAQLSTLEVSRIYSKEITEWQDVDKGTASFQQPIRVWMVPNGDPFRDLAEQVFSLKNPRLSEFLVAPDPAAMLTAISEDKGAIGFIPQSWCNTYPENNVKEVAIDNELADQFRLPVLAYTTSAPEGVLKSLLTCLQDANPP